jgi:hypothetical protein
MNNFVDFLLMAVNLKPAPPLLLSTLKVSMVVSDDMYNSIPGGDISCRIHTAQGISVGRFNYKIGSGEIGLILLETPFQHRALEQQILVYMMQDMAEAGSTHIWKSCLRDSAAGRIYANLWSFEFRESSIFPGMNTSGYIMEIPRDLRTLMIR